MKRFSLYILLLTLSAGCLAQAPMREMRGAWIATVANIDWPSNSAKGNATLQRKEMLQILDSAAALHLNMVVFQIRPTSDALYKSELEPWSQWLTGKQGTPNNDPSFDPLAFVVEEAHKRFIDVHVWLNPYRVTNGGELTQLADSHLIHQHPDWFVKYGTKWYFNPGLDSTRAHLNKVVADIVERYDIDAIHFDDYFYPYKVAGEVFPDAETFAAYPRGFTNINDWRRNNVNMVIRELSQTIHSRKPWVEFGISPFGVWRNASTDPVRGSKTRAGVQNYDDLYADILLWLEQGWIDYVAPQLYWEIGKKVADYQILVDWWQQYSCGQNFYAGQAVYCLANSKVAAWNAPNEICRQIALNRRVAEAAGDSPKRIDGTIFYPIHSVLENRLGLCDSLRTNYFRYPALPPANRNIVQHTDTALPAMSEVLINRTLTDVSISWLPYAGRDASEARYYVVYAFPQLETPDFSDPQYIYARTASTSLRLDIDPDDYAIYVAAFTRSHLLSAPRGARIPAVKLQPEREVGKKPVVIPGKTPSATVPSSAGTSTAKPSASTPKPLRRPTLRTK